MELTDNDLTKIVEKLESKILAKINFTSARFIDLDRLLCETFVRQCPKPIDYHNRRDLIRIFNVIAKEIYGNGDDSPVVVEYGSFVMDMFDGKSDLDLSINFNDLAEVSRQKQISTLRRFNKKLHKIQSKGHVTGIQTVLSARVPIIKVTDSGTGIECDLSVGNRDGITKSRIIRAISVMDERFRMLCLLMKSWAKGNYINSPKDKTLSSLSIVSIVAFHLQTCNPPILPPFSILLKDGDDPVSVAKVVKTYLNYGQQNRDSLAKLFITLFIKLASAENLWQKGFCASSYEGSWILKSWNPSDQIRVEDFADRSQNVARAVGSKELKTIYSCINKSLNYLMQFLNSGSNGSDLMGILFGTHTDSTLGVGVTSNIIKNKNNRLTLQNPRPPKRRHLPENQVQIPCDKKIVQDLQPTESHGVNQMHRALGENVDSMLASSAPYLPLIPHTNIKGNHSYGPGTVPSQFSFNSAPLQRCYNPPVPSNLVSSQNSLCFVGSRVHQQAVGPPSNLGSTHSHFPQVGHNPYREHTFFNHRSD